MNNARFHKKLIGLGIRDRILDVARLPTTSNQHLRFQGALLGFSESGIGIDASAAFDQVVRYLFPPLRYWHF